MPHVTKANIELSVFSYFPFLVLVFSHTLRVGYVFVDQLPRLSQLLGHSHDDSEMHVAFVL